MTLRRLTGIGIGGCSVVGDCPAVFWDASKNVYVIQGRKVDDETRTVLKMPSHEDAVELNPEVVEQLLPQHAKRFGR